MPAPFFIFLDKTHTLPKVTSDATTSEAKELQLLVDSSNKVAYRKKIEEYKEHGLDFRITKGKVYQIAYKGETIDVRIALQVKGHSLTWYFWAPDGMDQYPQEFRDKLYNAAAIAHKEVDDGCDLYYRGSNAVHVKLMHHIESESGHNHNHYRLKGNKSYLPNDFNQHLQALKKSEFHDLFFKQGEIDNLCNEFGEFYKKWTIKTKDKSSLEEEYFQDPSQQLETEDLVELQLFGAQQEPCRIDINELKVDYENARQEIKRIVSQQGNVNDLKQLLNKVEKEYLDIMDYRKKGGSRGLNSEIASTRQIKHSANPVIKGVVGMDDSLGKELPDIPDWAVNAKNAVEEAKKQMMAFALNRLDPEAKKNLSKQNVSMSSSKDSLFYKPQNEEKQKVKNDEEEQFAAKNNPSGKQQQ